MSEIRSVSVRLSARTGEFIAGMGAAKRSTDSLEGSLARVEARGTAASRGLSGLKHAAMYGAGGAVAGLVLAEKAAADFGEKMALVQTLSHANEQQMKRLSAAAMNTGQKIGYTATQVADGEAEMIKAGVSLSDILKGGLKGALDLAAAGQTDVATATTIAASAMTQFRLKGKDIPHLADLLAAGADKALGSVEDLGYGLEQAGTTAHQMGLSVEQTTGTLAAFAQAGLIGQRGGTTFKQMLLQLASPTKNAQAYMDQYGLSLYQANGQIKTMPQLADNLQRSFSRLTPAQRNAALGTIFGSRAIQGANILMAEGGKGIAEWIRKVNDQGFAAQQASGKLNSLKGDLAKFKGEVENDLINLGTGSQSPLRGLVQGATRELHKLRTNGDLKRWGNEISSTFTTIGQDVLPIAKEVGHALGVIGHDLGGIAQGFQKLPDGVQQAIVTGGVVAYGAHKLGVDSLIRSVHGGVGARGGVVGALTGRAGVVPVYVTGGHLTGAGVPGGPGGEPGGPRGIPIPRGGIPKTPTHLGIPQKFWDLTPNGARDLLSNSLGKVPGEGILRGALRGVLGAPAWITAGDAGHEVLPGKSLGPKAFSSMLAAAGAKKAADATREWAKEQAGLNALLMAPALPQYAAKLSSLPKQVQTKIATPGAVQSLADVAQLAKQYHLTPKQVRTLIELAGAGKVKSDAIAIGRLYGLTPKQVRTLISQAGMGDSQAQIRRLAALYHLTPKQVRTLVGLDGATSALAAIARIKAELGGIPRSISTSYYVNQVNSVSKAPVTMSPGHGKYATGGYTGDRPAHEPVGVVHGREFVFDATATAKAGVGNLYALQRKLRGYADGGYVGGRPGWAGAGWGSAYAPPPWWDKFLHIAAGFAGQHTTGRNVASTQVNVDGVGIFSVTKSDVANAKYIAHLAHQTHAEKIADRVAELQAQQQIRDLQKSLTEHKKDKKGHRTGALALTGLDRTEAKAELAQAKQQLDDLRSHADGVKQAIQQVRDNIAAARGNFASGLSSVIPTVTPKNPIEAGTKDALSTFKTEFTKAGGVWTKSMQRNATLLDRSALALDKANRAQDTLTTTLQTQQQQWDDLQSTMASFSSGVAGNFQSNPFGLGAQSTTTTPTVDTSPALSAATDQLNAAQAHLAALQTNDGTINQRLANAFQAQGVEANIAKLQAQVDQLSQPVTTVTDSLQSFRDTLTSDTQRANDFNTALQQLSSEGLNKDLFGQLASSGDVGLAQELAAAGQSAVSDINTLWNSRAAAAAQVAAYATQAVYGQQQAILQAQMAQTNAAIRADTAAKNQLTAVMSTLGQRVENGAKNGNAPLAAKVDDLASKVADLPRQIAHLLK